MGKISYTDNDKYNKWHINYITSNKIYMYYIYNLYLKIQLNYKIIASCGYLL